eukprot:1159566-Pelagomonas_calceolata.AAC.1
MAANCCSRAMTASGTVCRAAPRADAASKAAAIERAWRAWLCVGCRARLDLCASCEYVLNMKVIKSSFERAIERAWRDRLCVSAGRAWPCAPPACGCEGVRVEWTKRLGGYVLAEYSCL